MATLAGSQASPDPGSAVDYDERAARSVTVHVLPSITLAQVDKVFAQQVSRGDILPAGQASRLRVLSSPEFLDAARRQGAAIQPKSSASLPLACWKSNLGYEPPAEKARRARATGRKLKAQGSETILST